jgi:site-specific DNA-methyltransferase (adenine-specific)/adenine-specific DNA-methyltransferase
MWNQEDAYIAIDNFKGFIENQNSNIRQFCKIILRRLPKPITKEELKKYKPLINEINALFEEYVKDNKDKNFLWVNPSTGKPCYWKHESSVSVLGNNWASFNIEAYGDQSFYPTSKHEDLLTFIIKSQTNKNDIILDFFAGSGTTAAVAEKLGRRWIVCDIGKLAFYTMQKRILSIENSKDLEKPKKKYNKKAKSFITVNTGLYDLKKVFELKKDDYVNFVTNLFEVEPINKKISGIKIDGQKKDGYYVLVYPYWQFRNASVDEEYLEDLHSHIGSKIGERLYIIAPANYVDFISDYHEIGKTRYYFLKVPYQIIKELHKVQFKKFRQPQSKRNVNDLDDAVGFHFIRQPEVEARFIKNGKNAELQITKFLSNYLEEETGSELDNFESLAMVLIDKDYNGKEFVMDEFYFAEDLLPEKKEDETEDEIKKELKHLKKISIPMNKEDCGDRIMAVYVDIYGNEFKEVLSLKK